MSARRARYDQPSTTMGSRYQPRQGTPIPRTRVNHWGSKSRPEHNREAYSPSFDSGHTTPEPRTSARHHYQYLRHQPQHFRHQPQPPIYQQRSGRRSHLARESTEQHLPEGWRTNYNFRQETQDEELFTGKFDYFHNFVWCTSLVGGMSETSMMVTLGTDIMRLHDLAINRAQDIDGLRFVSATIMPKLVRICGNSSKVNLCFAVLDNLHTPGPQSASLFANDLISAGKMLTEVYTNSRTSSSNENKLKQLLQDYIYKLTHVILKICKIDNLHHLFSLAMEQGMDENNIMQERYETVYNSPQHYEVITSNSVYPLLYKFREPHTNGLAIYFKNNGDLDPTKAYTLEKLTFLLFESFQVEASRKRISLSQAKAYMSSLIETSTRQYCPYDYKSLQHVLLHQLRRSSYVECWNHHHGETATLPSWLQYCSWESAHLKDNPVDALGTFITTIPQIMMMEPMGHTRASAPTPPIQDALNPEYRPTHPDSYTDPRLLMAVMPTPKAMIQDVRPTVLVLPSAPFEPDVNNNIDPAPHVQLSVATEPGPVTPPPQSTPTVTDLPVTPEPSAMGTDEPPPIFSRDTSEANIITIKKSTNSDVDHPLKNPHMMYYYSDSDGEAT